MPGRKYSAGTQYRYGFNGKEENDEVKGDGNSLDFGARIYDTRLGRWLSLDPLMKKYPGESNYAFVSNSPLLYADEDGRDKIITITILNANGTTTQIQKIDKSYFEYSHDNAYSGLGYIYQESVSQHLIIDNRNGGNTTVEEAMNNPNQFIYTQEIINRKAISLGEFLLIKGSGFLGFFSQGDESNRLQYGFRIYGNGKDMDWQSGLPTAAEGVESVDFGKWFGLVDGLYGVTNTASLTEMILERLGGVKGDMKSVKVALDIVSDQMDKITSTVEKIQEAQDEISKMRPQNDRRYPVSDSATCEKCSLRGDSSHIDENNGKGTFQKLKDAGKTDKTKKKGDN